MRSEREMLDLIVGVARDDERIRAAIMNGSRANPNAPRDFFQDYDVVYFVTDMAPFENNLEWIKRFGELMILQMPEDMQDPPPSDEGGFGYLMQFTDGNRIDLGIYPLSRRDELLKDSLTLLLLDKDGVIGSLPPASEGDQLPKPPTAKSFSDCSNEFWWVCPYVAKGLWRGEILYAKYLLDQVVREQLMRMLACWRADRVFPKPRQAGQVFPAIPRARAVGAAPEDIRRRRLQPYLGGVIHHVRSFQESRYTYRRTF
jgi:aminoglycoside 6-adenylyltransferase